MVSSKDLKSTIDKIIKYDIIKNNSNILKEFDDCKSKISTLDNNVSLIFQTYFIILQHLPCHYYNMPDTT